MKIRNLLKKAGLALAGACLALGMLCTTAMAESVDMSKNGEANLTLVTPLENQNLKGYTFKLYQIASIKADGKGQLTYEAKEAYKGILNDVELNNPAKVQECLNQLSAAAVTPDKTLEGTDGDEGSYVTFSNLDLGYYLVKVDRPNGGTKINDFLVSVPMQAPSDSEKVEDTVYDGKLTYNVVVYLKIQTLTFEKTGDFYGNTGTGDDRSTMIGGTIDYTLTMKVPDTTGYRKYMYKVTDTMSKGLKLDQNSIVVKIKDQKIDAASDTYTLTVTEDETGTTTVIDFNQTFFINNKTTYKPGEELTITYKATVTEDVLDRIEEGLKNVAKLEYSNDPEKPDPDPDPKPDGEITSGEKIYHVYIIELTKTFSDGTTDFSDVVFKFDGKALKEKTPGTPGYYIPDPNADPNAEPIDLKLTEDGKLYILGVSEGIFYLEEIKTRPGYNLITDRVEINVNAKYGIEGKVTGTDEGDNPIDITTHTIKKEVVNKKGFTLPSTGGQDMVVLVATGICLMAAMVVLMISYMKKRRNA